MFMVRSPDCFPVWTGPQIDAAAADRRLQLGRAAGVLFLAGALASAPANQLLADPKPPDWIHVIDALGFLAGVACLLAPWRRLGGGWLHVLPVAASLLVSLTLVGMKSHAGVFVPFYLLVAICTGYFFRDRRVIAAHMGLLVASFATAASVNSGADPDWMVRVLVASPTICVAAAVVAWLREGLERTQAELRELAEGKRQESLTDPLTGLGNRRRLMQDLEARFGIGEITGTEAPATFVLFDLDGFKAYNDRFGHPAGDALLTRLGQRLVDAVAGHGEAYRLGGDEFCLIIEAVDAAAEHVVAEASVALSETGDSFEIAASHGVATLPWEAETPGAALLLADQRMYALKHGGRASAGQQVTHVLLRLLTERKPRLGEHVAEVAALARATARRLGLAEEQIDEIVRAAELHDIGKAAIPDAILEKPGPLTAAEQAFVQGHTIVGERIVNAAQALRPVARLVRHSHERFDGGGYPDGLAGEQIPLGARIIAVCDAFEAMISPERAYAPAMNAKRAAEELRRCAGSQFDPLVVEAFVAEAARRPSHESLPPTSRTPARPA
jgi:diguanylate cyclase (GGDEF)-like protein